MSDRKTGSTGPPKTRFDVGVSAELLLGARHVPLMLAFRKTGGALTYSGTVPDPAQISVADFVAAFPAATKDHELPAFLRDLSVAELSAKATQGGDASFLCAVDIALDGRPARLALHVGAGGSFSGRLTLGDPQAEHPLELEVHFGKDAAQTRFAASLTSATVNVKSIVRAVSEELAGPIPDDLNLHIDRLRFAYETGAGADKPTYVTALDLGAVADLDWSGLPLIGSKIPTGKGLSMDSLHVLISNADLNETLAKSFNALFPDAGQDAPVPEDGAKAGVQIGTALNIGERSYSLTTPLSAPQDTAPEAPKDADKGRSFKLGPLSVDGITFAFRDGRVWIIFNAALAIGTLRMGLEGLSIGFALDDLKHPKFSIEGIALGVDAGPAQISGELIHETKGGHDLFAGSALLETEALTLSAVGAYEEYQGHTSLFLYAVLDKPIGGPAFFFVTGLAAGFGYNRRLLSPAIDEVEDFPLITAAMRPAGGDPQTASRAMLRDLKQYLPDSEGDSFLAVGVRFTTFEIIDSFVLVTLGFGKHFSAKLLGISTLESPPRLPGTNTIPLARVRIALEADVEQDALRIDGKILTGSYVFSKDCSLSGSFAFYSWFAGAHAGDFVLTAGGYHPDFHKPAHYPKANRIALNWQVNDALSIKGRCYFALTSGAMMAGGRLAVVWEDGSLKAWFRASADFIVEWEPYHYDARMSVTVGASYTFSKLGFSKTFQGEVSANVHLWGPKFAARAEVDIGITSFVIEYGKQKSVPEPIGWAHFQSALLPKEKDVCSITIKSGLAQTIKPQGAKEASAEIWVVNAKDLVIAVETAIPASRFAPLPDWIDAGDSDLSFDALAIRPMGKTSEQVRSDLRVTINNPGKGAFRARDIRKRVPTALWGKPKQPTLYVFGAQINAGPTPNGPRLVDNALTGLEIRAPQIAEPDVTPNIDAEKLKSKVEQADSHPVWRSVSLEGAKSEGLPAARGIETLPKALLSAFNLDDFGGTA